VLTYLQATSTFLIQREDSTSVVSEHREQLFNILNRHRTDKLTLEGRDHSLIPHDRNRFLLCISSVVTVFSYKSLH